MLCPSDAQHFCLFVCSSECAFRAVCCNTWCWSVFQCVTACCSIVRYAAVRCAVVQYVMHHSAVQCCAVWCSVLRCCSVRSVCCSVSLRVAVYCMFLQRVAVFILGVAVSCIVSPIDMFPPSWDTAVQFPDSPNVCCSVLQSFGMWCSTCVVVPRRYRVKKYVLSHILLSHNIKTYSIARTWHEHLPRCPSNRKNSGLHVHPYALSTVCCRVLLECTRIQCAIQKLITLPFKRDMWIDRVLAMKSTGWRRCERCLHLYRSFFAKEPYN